MSAEHRTDRLPLLVREKVAISTTHGLGLVSHPIVGDPLIDTFEGTVARKRVTQHMIALNHLPGGFLHGGTESLRQHLSRERFPSSARDREGPARMMRFEPSLEYTLEPVGHRHGSESHLASSVPFLLADHDRPGF